MALRRGSPPSSRGGAMCVAGLLAVAAVVSLVATRCPTPTAGPAEVSFQDAFVLPSTSLGGGGSRVNQPLRAAYVAGSSSGPSAAEQQTSSAGLFGSATVASLVATAALAAMSLKGRVAASAASKARGKAIAVIAQRAAASDAKEEDGEEYDEEEEDDFQADGETGTIVGNDAKGYDGLAYDYDEDYDVDDDEYDEDEEGEDDDEIIEARCLAKNVQGSWRKYERVLWQIRGRSYRNALMMLEFMPWRHCKPTLKALQSAAANAQNHFNMDKSRLYITRCRVTPARKMKRMRPVSKGQTHPYTRHHSHLEIYVGERTLEEAERLRKSDIGRNDTAFDKYYKKNHFAMPKEYRQQSKGRHYI